MKRIFVIVTLGVMLLSTPAALFADCHAGHTDWPDLCSQYPDSGVCDDGD